MISQSLLPEFDVEMANTRKTLERVPDGKFDWKPHAKSGALGWLAGHLANIPSWTVLTVERDSIDLGGMPPPAPPKTARELVEMFDTNAKAARAAIASASDEEWMKPWSLKMNGNVLFTMPKGVVLRSFVMNHMIHHRAQLGVYLRLNDVPVPAIYGPSADEQGM